MNILSLDPGIDFAACLWTNGTLVWAAFRSLPASEIIDELVAEDQEITQRTFSPRSIIKLARTSGRLAERVHAKKEPWVLPVTWMGGSPPHFQVETRVLGCLTSEERRVFDRAAKDLGEKRHNLTDAAGIGLFALKRLPRS